METIITTTNKTNNNTINTINNTNNKTTKANKIKKKNKGNETNNGTRKIIEDYLKDISISQYSEKTVRVRRYFLQKLDSIKRLEHWTKEDVKDYLFNLSNTAKPSTVEHHKAVMLGFFKAIGKPDVVQGLKPKLIENSLQREDILTYEDVMRLVDATDSPFYKALIIFLFESGARIMEILETKVSDVYETNKGMVIKVHQTKRKTQLRDVICIYSGQFIRNHLSYMNLQRDAFLFPSPQYIGQHIETTAIRKALRQIAQKAGITKPVNPHNFRHSWATNMVILGYPESMVKKGGGWKPASRAIDRYTHLVDTDFIDARLRKEGKIDGADQPQAQLPELKLAEPIMIPDDRTILRRLVVENQELQKRLSDAESVKAEIQSIKEAFGMITSPDGKISFQANLRELPQQPQQKMKGKSAVITSDELDTEPAKP